jgi:hypothetical protein
MAEDILAHEDSSDPSPTHHLDTVKVADYITTYLPHQILENFVGDMEAEPNTSKASDTNVREASGYGGLVTRLTEVMGGFFRHASGELRAGVRWGLSDWVDLQLHDEIAASDVQIVIQVTSAVVRADCRIRKRWCTLRSRCPKLMKVWNLQMG